MKTIVMISAFLLTISLIAAESGNLKSNDSTKEFLNIYLLEAAANNPELKEKFLLYKLELEKISQAGAHSDPELSMGLFLQPMPTLMGKQRANITLMQMFPWFGTRSSAKSEASEMAKMAYELFKENRDRLFLEVKKSWYDITLLKLKIENTKLQLLLLEKTERLATQSYSSVGAALGSSNISAMKVKKENTMSSSLSEGMSMGGMSQNNNSINNSAPEPSRQVKSMDAMAAMLPGRGMSAILQIQIERMEVENELISFESQYELEMKKFNLLLNRDLNLNVETPDSLTILEFELSDIVFEEKLTNQNPMLEMLKAEEAATSSKAKMLKKMSYPMIGLGVEYSIFSKDEHSSMGMEKMNGKNMIMPMFKLSLPIFRVNYRSQQRELKLKNESLNSKYIQTFNSIRSEYIELISKMEEEFRAIKLTDKQMKLLHATYNLMEKEFSTGNLPMTELIELERQILSYKIKRDEAVTAYNKLIAVIESLLSLPVDY